MKKAIVLCFLLTSLFLTACQTQTAQTSAPERTDKATTTESTTTTQTSDTTRTTDTEATSDTTDVSDTTQASDTETTAQKTEDIETKSKNVVLFKTPYSEYFFETPMGITFVGGGETFFENNTYQKDTERLAYYVPKENKAYFYCFDPTCDHSGSCVSIDLVLCEYSDYDDRLYSSMFYYFTSYSKYGMDKQTIDRSEIPEDAAFWDIVQYKNYLYLRASLAEDSQTHIIRYNIDDGTMVDLTKQTGYYFSPSYFYDDYVYGSSYTTENGVLVSEFGRTDLDFECFEPVTSMPQEFSFVKGTEFFDVYQTDNGRCGITIYDAETEEQTVLPQELIGRKVLQVVCADEEHIYFLAHEPKEFYDVLGNSCFINQSGGKIYRINRDGTNRICIYDNELMSFQPHTQMYVDGNVLLTHAARYVPNSKKDLYNGVYIGRFDKNGKIENLKWLEYEESVFIPLKKK